MVRELQKVQASFQKLMRRELARLEYVACRDPLMGLLNRPQLEKHLAETFTNAKQHQTPFTFYFIDIDKFKQVNDVFGHHVGDTVLIHVGKTLNQAFPNQAYRYGGEELGVLLTGGTRQDAIEKGTRLMGSINKTNRQDPQDTVIRHTLNNPNSPNRRDLSLSIGMIHYDGREPLPPWLTSENDLIVAANNLERAAKRTGRNRLLAVDVKDLNDVTAENINEGTLTVVPGPAQLIIPQEPAVP